MKNGRRSESLRKFLRNKAGLAGLAFIILTSLAAIFAYLISPDNSPDANAQNLSIAAQKPGFRVQMLKLKRQLAIEENAFSGAFMGRNKAYSEVALSSYTLLDSGIRIREYDSENLGLERTYKYEELFPSANSKVEAEEKISEIIEERTFMLGTDRFGRDMLSRMILGARVSLAVGFISVLISLIVGITLGTLAGYFRGKTDLVIQWLINVIWSLPTLLLVVAITFVLGKGFWQIFIAVGLSMWVEVARMLRGQIFSLREKEFIEAAKVLGYSHFRIIRRHILPNVMAPLIVVCAANFASAILLEAGLSFLGLGVQAPTPSWGMMIKDHFGYIVLDSAYLAIIPGVAIMLLVMSFNFVGNALRDALDVHMKD